MHTIAKNALKWKRIGMDVQRLLILVVQKLISGMKERSMGLKRDDEYLRL